MPEPGLDLAIALSLVSAHQGRPLLPGALCLGEIGLTGEVRPVSRIDRRLAEAARLGLATAVVPSQALVRVSGVTMEIIPVENIKQAVQFALLRS